MVEVSRTVRPGKTAGTVIDEEGAVHKIPQDWELLPPGDGPLTKLVKSKGPAWLVQVKKGRRMMSRGIWANAESIRAAREEIAVKRSDPAYAKRREKDLGRRNSKQQEYVREFCEEVLRYLDFHPRYNNQALQLAEEVTQHATPVGSGTVARTKRIPLQDRAKSAVIAWLRHHTTDYDTMKIARVRGRRREVRKKLASQSLCLLEQYRKGGDIALPCPLRQALSTVKQAK